MQDVTRAELEHTISSEKDALVINVLPAAENEQQSIAGSVNIPVKDNPQFVEAVKQRISSYDHKIIVYCASEDCMLAREAQEQLRQAGFTNVWDYEPGVKGWFKDQQEHAAM